MTNSKKIMFIISLVFLLSIIFSTNSLGYFRNEYWECTRSGEKSEGDFFGRLPNSGLYDANDICKKSCCILCAARSPISDCFGGNAKPMCSCSQGTSTDTTLPELNVNSPIENNIYNKRVVDFNLNANERAKLDYLDNNDIRRGYRILCKNCLSYNRKVNFKDGLNDITIRATDNSGNKVEKRMSFSVDSKKPKISKTEPKNGNYGNGVFTVHYSEENVRDTRLFYKYETSSEYNVVGKNDCPSGRKETCVFNVENMQDGNIFYYFELEDVTNTKAASKESKITIDNTNPVINLDPSLVSNEIKTYDNKLPLILSVSEKVTLEYKDLNSNKPFTRICRNCDSYDKNIKFREGNHDIIIKATDKAGNFDEENLVFNIV